MCVSARPTYTPPITLILARYLSTTTHSLFVFMNNRTPSIASREAVGPLSGNKSHAHKWGGGKEFVKVSGIILSAALQYPTSSYLTAPILRIVKRNPTNA
jgi:hypothetical protein